MTPDVARKASIARSRSKATRIRAQLGDMMKDLEAAGATEAANKLADAVIAVSEIEEECTIAILRTVVLDDEQQCPSCGRDFSGDNEPDAQPGQPCPATDDCPSHAE